MTLKHRMYLFLFILTVVTAFGFQGWRTLFNNFAVEVGHITGQQMGLIQSIREVPGLLVLLIVYLLPFITERRLAAASVAVMGIGIGATGLFPGVYGLILTTLLMSVGFHCYQTMNQSLILQHFDIRQAPLVLGKLRATGAVVNIAAGGIILLGSGLMSYKGMYLALGAFVVMVGGGCIFFRAGKNEPDAPGQHKRMVFRSRYWLYYVLTFLAGARRQIFVAFAVYLLVTKFNFSIQEVIGLFVVNNIIATIANPLVGRAVNRFGERTVLSLEYLTLVVVFSCYAFSDSKLLVIIMYIVDHLVFSFTMAIQTFFQKIADSKDISSSMAMGGTINHIAAVIIPVLGGMTWTLHPAAVFMIGMALSTASLLFTQLIPKELAKRSLQEKTA
jgi:MFS family permease